MPKQTWLWVGGITALTLVGGLKYRDYRDGAELKEQLRLAWAEGIPTSAEQIASLVRKGDPSRNAGPYYTTLVGTISAYVSPRLEIDELLATPNAVIISKAKAFLKSHASDLSIAEAATALPDCWIEADWKQGAAIVRYEGGVMNKLSGCLALRAALAATNGDRTRAIADINRIFRMAEHARSQPFLWGPHVADTIYLTALRLLAHLSVTDTYYLSTLKDAVDAFPKLDVKRERSGYLFFNLSAGDLCMTPAGRALLGAKPDDMGASDYIYPVIFSQTTAKIAMVKAEREIWATLSLPWEQRRAVLSKASESVERANLAFPILGHHREVLGDDGYPESRPENWESRRLQFTALIRALTKGKPANATETKDLLSPFDGKPLSYSYNGEQIIIGVSREQRDPLELRVPSNEVIAKRKK